MCTNGSDRKLKIILYEKKNKKLIFYQNRHHYRKCIPIEAIRTEVLVDLHSYLDRIKSFYHAWSDVDCSENMFVLPNGFTVHRRCDLLNILFCFKLQSFEYDDKLIAVCRTYFIKKNF